VVIHRFAMLELTASEEYYDAPPARSDRDAVQTDAPALTPILEEHPDIHIYTKSNPHFANISKVRVERTDMQALAIVRPTSEAQISTAIRHCAEAGIGIAIRSGGNDIAERSRSHGGVVIDMRSLDPSGLGVAWISGES
jgi:hypothetical protein